MLEAGSRALALAAIRRSSIAIRTSSTRDRSFHASDPDFEVQSGTGQREDITTTVRRPSYNDTEGSASVVVTSPNIDQQPPLPPANSAGISPTDDSGELVRQGMDLDNVMNTGDLEGLDKRNLKDKEKGKGEDLDVAVMRGPISSLSSSPNVAPWAEADDTTGLRLPSTVTLDDSFAGSLRRDDPDYALRRNEWSFIRERGRVSLPPRRPNSNPRHWDVWRCSQIGQVRIERATLTPCTLCLSAFLSHMLTQLCFMSRFFCSRPQQAESAASQCGA